MVSKQVLLTFLDEVLGVDSAGVEGNTPLFSSGLIDSAAMVELIVFVEKQSGVRFGPDDITLDNLDTIDSILNFVSSQQGDRGD